MGNTTRLWASMLALGSMVLAMDGCGGAGSAASESRSIERGNATSLRADLQLTSGKLTLRGGATALMNGDFITNEKLKPEINYDVNGGQGHLVIKQPDHKVSVNLGSSKNDWDVRLNDGVPVDLNVKVTSGDTNLDLTTLAVKSLIVDSSSGSIAATLGGTHKELTDVRAQSSSGWMNLTLNGSYAKLSGLQVSSSSGGAMVDLGGIWAANLDGTIKPSSGSVTVRVPKSVGVIVTTSTSSGNVHANGFKINNQSYTNDAYGSASVTLKLNVQVSSGNINLELVG